MITIIILIDKFIKIHINNNYFYINKLNNNYIKYLKKNFIIIIILFKKK